MLRVFPFKAYPSKDHNRKIAHCSEGNLRCKIMLKQFKSFWQKSWIFHTGNILNQQKPIQKFQMFEIIEENNINTLFNLSLRFFRSYSFRNLRHIWEFNYLLSSHFWKNQVKKTCLTPILFNWSFFVNVKQFVN